MCSRNTYPTTNVHSWFQKYTRHHQTKLFFTYFSGMRRECRNKSKKMNVKRVCLPTVPIIHYINLDVEALLLVSQPLGVYRFDRMDSSQMATGIHINLSYV